MSNRSTAAANAALAAAPVGEEVEAEGWDTDPEVGEEGDGEEGGMDTAEGGTVMFYLKFSCGMNVNVTVM